MVRVWPQCWQVVRDPRDKIWDLLALVWPIRTRVITIPFDLNQLLDIEVDQWLQICIVDTCKWLYIMVRGLFCWLVHYLVSLNATVAWYPTEMNTCAFVTQKPKWVHGLANKRLISVFTLDRLQAGHWVRVDYYIMVNGAHVSVIVQCQSDGCSLSSKDGAVVWQSFGQVAAGCLTILDVAVDDYSCPYSLVHFGAIGVDFVWSLSFMILIELSPGFLFGDHITVTVIGSSIVRGVAPLVHGKGFDACGCVFPGRTARAINARIRNIPVTDVTVLAAGTNNIETQTVEECSKEIYQTIDNVARKRRQKPVVMSLLPHRYDKPKLNHKIDAVNDFIAQEVNKRPYWYLLKHNVSRDDFKSDGLHFNSRGTAKYAHEIRHIIRSIKLE